MSNRFAAPSSLIQAGGVIAGTAALGVSPLVFARPKTIKIGYVSPQTGPLAPFGEADKWVIDADDRPRSRTASTIGGKKYAVQIILKDSQSNPNRAGEVANDLILKDKVDADADGRHAGDREPGSDACELNEVPCISSVVPWQPWFFGRKGDPAKGFDWTYHMFWGLEDVIANFTERLEDRCRPTRRSAACSRTTATATRGATRSSASRSRWRQMGFTLTDPGRFQNGTQDFSAQIAAFKKDGVEIVTGVVIPPDAKTFLTQARQQGFKPKVITLGKALLFPGAIEALGDLGDGLSTEVWWSPSHPFTSSLTKQSAKAAGRRLRDRREEAVDAADRLRACAVRGRGRCAEAQPRASRRHGRARRGRGDQPRRPSSARSSGAARARSRTSARRRWCSANGSRAAKYKIRADDRQQRGGATNIPTGGKLRLIVTRCSSARRKPSSMPLLALESASPTARSRSPTTSRSR